MVLQMPLNEFQTSFRDLMLDHPDAVNTPPEGVSNALETDRLSARLKIYRNNIVGSLTDVICASFPIIEALVGREFLELMARSFVLEQPPEQGCLNLYGAGFDNFIADFELARTLPYLPDVARFELAMNAAYYAPDDEPFSAQDLAAIPPEELHKKALNLRQSATLLQSPYPLQAIKEFCEKTERADDEKIDLQSGGAKLLIYRPELDTEIITLKDNEFFMLSALQKGKTLGQALETTLNTYPDFNVQSFLQIHLSLETFTP